MNTKYLYDYYAFGNNYRLLLDGRQGRTIDQVMAELKEYGGPATEIVSGVVTKADPEDKTEK
jgi:hypothetical protein